MGLVLTGPMAAAGFVAKMKWSHLCEDKSLQDLPYKIELNAQGQIIMSPHKPIHSGFQGAILILGRVVGRVTPCAPHSPPEMPSIPPDSFATARTECDAPYQNQNCWKTLGTTCKTFLPGVYSSSSLIQP